MSLYDHYIYHRTKDLLKSKPITNWDNYDISKIFEYYCALKLNCFEYNDIDPDFKEKNQMSRMNNGIDLCNLVDSIVQCKLRLNSLSWSETSTFFGSQVYYDGKSKIRWKNMILARNSECNLAEHLKFKLRNQHFTDFQVSREEILNYCTQLIENPPKYTHPVPNFQLRDYQIEAIDLIKSNGNCIICLPTGCGKMVIVVKSMEADKRYLILVPRIILMDQMKDMILKFHPEWKKDIECLGDGHNVYTGKRIVICVYNSIHQIENFEFSKIFVDEAHHIAVPELYEDDIDHESYISKIEELKVYNNNIYLSATIDPIDGFFYYKKDIREMIQKRYITDYQIHVPIFENANEKSVCNHLIKNYRSIIIYCSSQAEAKRINDCMNSLMTGCCEYLDCFSKKTERNRVLNAFKSGDLPFITNVRILVEGFDAAITKGVCFFNLPSSKISVIQIIGRALRLHPNKTIANVILPFSKNENNTSINKFIKIIASNDSRIRRSYNNKTLGGYVNIDMVDCGSEIFDLKFNMIYNSLGLIINNEDLWDRNLQWVIDYLDSKDKRPSSRAIDKDEKYHGGWILTQCEDYKYNRMKILRRKKWEDFVNNMKYAKFFTENDEDWVSNLEIAKAYIRKYEESPKTNSEDEDERFIGKWISHQKERYKIRDRIMSNDTIYNLWTDFIKDPEFYEYLRSEEELWNDNLTWVKTYIQSEKKTPKEKSKDPIIRYYGKWMQNQKTTIKIKSIK